MSASTACYHWHHQRQRQHWQAEDDKHDVVNQLTGRRPSDIMQTAAELRSLGRHSARWTEEAEPNCRSCTYMHTCPAVIHRTRHGTIDTSTYHCLACKPSQSQCIMTNCFTSLSITSIMVHQTHTDHYTSVNCGLVPEETFTHWHQSQLIFHKLVS